MGRILRSDFTVESFYPKDRRNNIHDCRQKELPFRSGLWIEGFLLFPFTAHLRWSSSSFGA